MLEIPPKAAALVAWLIVAAVIGIFGGLHIVPQLVFLHDLARSNRVTQGEVVETYPQVHSTCKYRYSVDQQFYEQTGGSCGNDRVGQKVGVYFSPNDPSKSLNADPAAAFLNDLGASVSALVVLPLFAAIATYIRTRRAAAAKG